MLVFLWVILFPGKVSHFPFFSTRFFVLKTKKIIERETLSVTMERKLFTFSFAGDTCTALEDFQQDPYNSSLSSILPCNELLSAKPVLSDVSAGIYDLVNEVKID